MKCPACSTTDFLMTERMNIEIDYCPQCRGVWLDRGELDKIIERSNHDVTPVAVRQSAVPIQPQPPQYDNHQGHRDNHHDGHQAYRGKKSIWKELFD